MVPKVYTAGLVGGGDARGIIAPQWPEQIVVQNNTVIDVQLEYGHANSGRNKIVNQQYEIQLLNEQGITADAATQATNQRQYNRQASIQVISSGTARTAADAVDAAFVIPNYYDGEVILINTQVLGVQLENWYVGNIRRLITRENIIKKVKILVYDPPVGGAVNVSVPLEARRVTENFKFICPTGITGLQSGPENEKALTFSRYARDASSTRRITNVIDRPSRFLVRGTGIPGDRVLSNQDVVALTQSLKDPKMQTYENRAIIFVPKINMGNDLLSIRSVICVGYTDVAGKSRRKQDAERLRTEQTTRQTSEKQPTRKERQEGGQD
jgi:hypothetical protein